MRTRTSCVGVNLDGYVAGPADQIDFNDISQPLLAHMRSSYPEVLPGHVRAGRSLRPCSGRSTS